MDKKHKTDADKQGERAPKPATKPASDTQEKAPSWNPADDIYGEKPPVDRGLDFEHPRYSKPPPKPDK